MAIAYPPQPVVLQGEHVRLEPLSLQHAAEISEAVLDGRLFEHWYTMVPHPDAVRPWIEQALEQQARGQALPFVQRRIAQGDLVGSTRYMNIEQDRRRLEIGTTWLARRVQKSALNTEAKLLLLTHAFEQLEVIAVEFRTHFFNFQSREAIAKLGAKQDGILRNFTISANGTLRDTVVFSILNSEWPTVKAHLRYRLTRERH
jgi:RimJ/RimL family protein N-acetyltransferase